MVLGPSNRNCACKARLDFELGPALRVVSAPVILTAYFDLAFWWRTPQFPRLAQIAAPRGSKRAHVTFGKPTQQSRPSTTTLCHAQPWSSRRRTPVAAVESGVAAVVPVARDQQRMESGVAAATADASRASFELPWALGGDYRCSDAHVPEVADRFRFVSPTVSRIVM